MTVLRNINPLGQVDLPLIGRQGDPVGAPGTGCLEPGEEFECTPDQARVLLAQTGNYEPADAEAQQLADELAAEAAPVEEPAPTPPAPDAPPADTGSTPPADQTGPVA